MMKVMMTTIVMMIMVTVKTMLKTATNPTIIGDACNRGETNRRGPCIEEKKVKNFPDQKYLT